MRNKLERSTKIEPISIEPHKRQTNLLGELLTRLEVAEQLSTCTHTVARYAKRGLLPEIILGPRLIRYRREDVERLIESGQRSSPTIELPGR